MNKVDKLLDEMEKQIKKIRIYIERNEVQIKQICREIRGVLNDKRIQK